LHYKTDNIKEISKDFGNANIQSPGGETGGSKSTAGDEGTAGTTAGRDEKAAANAAGGAEKTAAKIGKGTAAAERKNPAAGGKT